MARTFGGRPTLGQMTRQPWGGVTPVGGGFDTQAPFSQAPETQAPFFAPPETQGPFGVRAGDSQGPGWSPAPSFAPPETQGAGWGAPPTVDPWAISQAVNVGPMSFGGNRATLAKLARGGR